MRVPIALAAGLVSDETTFSTPGVYADGSNVRFWNGRPEVIGGWASAFTDALTGTCRGVRAWTDNSGIANIAFGTHSALMVYKAGELADVTPVGLAAGSIDGAGGPGFGTGDYGEGLYGANGAGQWYARTWSLQNYGESLIACPRGGTAYLWSNNVASVATEITNAPDQIECILVTPERQLLAFGCNEEVSTDYNGMCIRGSDIEDITNWTTATSNAFEHILEGGGRIIAARMLGAYVAVWTDTGVHLGQFIGQTGQAYRFDPVAQNCGALGPNAVTVVNQTAYWITPDLQFYSWALGSPPAPISCPIHRDFADNFVVSQSEKVFASAVTRFGEIWWHYPDARDGIENSRFVAFSVFTGAWFRGAMERTAFIDSGPTEYPLGVDGDGAVYWHENGHSANGGAITWFIETSAQYLSEAQQWVLVRGVWPDFEAQTGAISLTAYVREYPQGDARTKGPWTLSPNRSKKDFLFQGRVAALRFSGSSAPTFMRFGKPSFDVENTGQK
jgi:hypothetical protein